MMGAEASPDRLPVLLHRAETVAAPLEGDQLLPLLIGAVLERLRELPGSPETIHAAPQALAGGARRAVLSVAEAADALGISTSLAYRLVREGELPSVQLGRRLVVPRVAIERALNMAVARAVDAQRTHEPWTAAVVESPSRRGGPRT